MLSFVYDGDALQTAAVVDRLRVFSIVDGMVRISCGLEDLISDLEQALRGADGNDTQFLAAESEKGINHAP